MEATVRHSQLENHSHILKNPLTTVLGFLELLQARAGSMSQESRARPVATSLRCRQQLLAIIRDLLDVARLEEGRLTPDVAPVVTVGMVREAASALSVLAEAHGKTVTVDKAGARSVCPPANNVFENTSSRLCNLYLILITASSKSPILNIISCCIRFKRN